jgi:NADH-quinone oxidoreductase subunit N
MAAHPESHTFMLIGLGLLLIGFAFKVAAVPFHQWAPDVYEGAPTCVTAFLSVGPKVAGFAALLRVFGVDFGYYAPDHARIFAALAVLTMLVGNVTALAQMNIKRMLAYSSIAHAGYLLVGVMAGGDAGRQSVLFYGLAYAFMNLGAFTVVLLLGGKGEENLRLDDYKGLWARDPLLAVSMAVFLFSLAGIPLTGGFYGKYLLFSAAVGAGYVGVAVLGVLCSLISVFFYFRVVWYMFMQQPVGELVIDPHPIARKALYLCLVGVFWLGVAPHFFFLTLIGGATMFTG